MPGTGERLAVDDLADAMDSRPLPETCHQVLLDSVAEDVLQPRGLRLLLAADHDRLVAPLPDLARPAGEPADLPRQVGIEIADELREPFRVLHPEDAVVVVRNRDEGHEVDRIEPLGPAEDAGGDVIELAPGWAGAAGVHARSGR